MTVFERILRVFVYQTTLFLWGGVIYLLIERWYKGYFPHWSMFAAGGTCLVVINLISFKIPWSLGFIWQTLICTAAIVVVELVFGLVVNIWLGMNVWDYSDLPLQLWGQISLLFTVYWIPLAAFGIWLVDFLRHHLYKEQKPEYASWF
jgi:uncharacterized membrane protein